jgi:V-type H+-transporting ATPase 21kDa proteolipid subunit
MLKILLLALGAFGLLNYCKTRILPDAGPIYGYIGIVMCFSLCAWGSSKGILTISRYVSGTAIRTPRVTAKSILGTVICEANFMLGLIHCISMYFGIKKGASELTHCYMLSSGLIVGTCSYCSSIATGMVCGVITLMDAKDQTLFYKLVVLEIIPASIGVIGFVLGIFIIRD